MALTYQVSNFSLQGPERGQKPGSQFCAPARERTREAEAERLGLKTPSSRPAKAIERLVHSRLDYGIDDLFAFKKPTEFT